MRPSLARSQSARPNRRGSSPFTEPVQPVAPAEIANLGPCVWAVIRSLADSDEAFHRRPAPLEVAEVALSDGLPDQFGDTGFLTLCPRVERTPQLVVQIKLCSPHDVYYTSSSTDLFRVFRASQSPW